jgi:hypothetical protein
MIREGCGYLMAARTSIHCNVQSENTQFLVFSTVPLIRPGNLDPDRQDVYRKRALKILKDLDAAGRLEPRRRSDIADLESQLGR